MERCLEKEPERRFQSARELLRSLRALREDLVGGEAAPGFEELPAAAVEDRGAPSLAVLPFVNLNRDEEDDFFSDGLTEELINALTRIEGIRVASRTSAFRFKGERSDVRGVGRELEVDSVLEGSVRRAGNRLRITVQLVDAEDGFHRWSQRYDRQLEDIFDVQDDVARAVVEELEGELAQDQDTVVRPSTRNLDAYDLYLRGRYQWERLVPEGFEAAIDYFGRAKEMDPGFAQPRAWLAVAYEYLVIFGLAAADSLDQRIRTNAESAVELDERLAEAHEAMGIYRQYFQWDWEGTERAYRRAMELNPGDALARAWYAIFVVKFPDRIDEAIAEARRAVELDPASLEANAFVVYVCYFADRTEEAHEHAEKLLDLYPGSPITYYALGHVETALGRYQEAAETFRKGTEVAPGHVWCSGSLAYALGRAGAVDEARRLLEELKQRRRESWLPALWIAYGHLGLGEHEESIEWLEQAVEERGSLTTFVGVWPSWRPLLSDRRTVALLERMGLEPRVVGGE